MIDQKKFDEIKSKHNCGYWDVCWEHACPCEVSNKDLQKDIYDALVDESMQFVEQCDEEGLFDEDDYDDSSEDDYDNSDYY